MKQRIDRRLDSLRREGRTGLAAYLVAGDPDPDATLRAMGALVASGVSLLEIGMPFSDPVADGPAIAAAHERSLEGGQTLRGIFDLVDRFRQRDAETPVVLMGYVNPALSLGTDSFFREAARCGADGALLVDLPLEHSGPWNASAAAHGLALVPLWAPTAPPGRERRILGSAPSLVYMVARTGITGSAEVDLDAVRERALRARRDFHVPVAAGFGIREPGQAKALAGSVDLVVVGSLFVERLASGGVEEVGRIARELVEALDRS